MKQRGKRSYASVEQFIHQTIVKIESPGIPFSPAFGKYSRPGDGKTVGLDAQVAHQLDIFGVPVVVVTRDIAGF
jgi:hypothetical protein